MNQDGKNYLPFKDSAFAVMDTMKAAYTKYGADSATRYGFRVLGRTGRVRRQGIQVGTSTAGGQFVLDVLVCMSVGTVPSTFKPDLALGSGVFDVRPSGAYAPAAVAYNSPSAKTSTQASPLWGAEAATPAGNPVWPPVAGVTSWPAGSYLVYGYPLGGSLTTDGFELSTLPVPGVTGDPGPYVNISADPPRVGLCLPVVTQVSGKTAAQLLNHDGTILPVSQPGFCTNPPSPASASTSWLQGLRTRLAAVFSPSLAFAQGEDSFIGGLPSGWSPNSVTQIISSDITLAFTTQPTNTTTGSLPQTVVVTATTTEPQIPPLNVRLAIAGNNGTPAFFTINGGADTVSFVDVTAQPTSATTATATYVIGYTKAGGYTLSAVGFIGGSSVRTPTAVSTLFQVQNK